jgi:hypothetical protein
VLNGDPLAKQPVVVTFKSTVSRSNPNVDELSGTSQLTSADTVAPLRPASGVH